MKIVFTGGGTGGHFYPIIAVAQEVRKLIKENKLLEAKFYYAASAPYNASLLFDNSITFIHVPAGKLRRYFSLLNITDIFKTIYGIFIAIARMFAIYPDVIFSKGGYDSFPVVLAGRALGIPIFVHESDSVPGRANIWAGKFAKLVAVSYPEAAEYFNKDKVAWVGCPIRQEVVNPATEGAVEFLDLESGVPTILVLGGSQGSQIINEVITDILPLAVEKYQIIHQTGKNNLKEIKETADVVLLNSAHKNRYKPFDYLNALALKMSAGASSLVVSRAGSTIFEIALWKLPSILIPITDSNGDHQRRNAFNYARSGAASVIEENNLTPEILLAEIDRIISNKKVSDKMKAAAADFAKLDAGRKIAEEIVNISLSHEK